MKATRVTSLEAEATTDYLATDVRNVGCSTELRHNGGIVYLAVIEDN